MGAGLLSTRIRRWRGLVLVALLGTVALTACEGGDISVFPLVVNDTFQGLTPARLLDTRNGEHTVDGQFQGVGAIGPSGPIDLTVAGRGGVPVSDVGAVALNLTVTGPTLNTYVTVYPTGSPRPNASNLNVGAGSTRANMVMVPVGADGKVTIYNNGGFAHVVVDVLGWFPVGKAFSGLSPARVLDTRSGMNTIDGLSAGVGKIGMAQSTIVQVGGRGGVPATGVGAVAVNLTGTEATVATFFTAYPADAARPAASNLNLAVGETGANMVVVPLSADGQLAIYNNGGTSDAIIDVLGWFPASATAFTGLSPTRILDTRVDGTTIDGGSQGIGRLGGQFTLTVGGRAGVPAGAGAGAVAVNITVTNPTVESYLTVFPADRGLPLASNLNFTVGQTVANMAVLPLSSDGKITLFTAGSTDVIVDVLGWFPPAKIMPTVTRISVSDAGTEVPASADDPDVSADGRFVTFSSYNQGITVDDTNDSYDVFVRDRATSSTVRVSGTPTATSWAPQQIGSDGGSISGDGRFVAFRSVMNGIIPGLVTAPGSSHIYVRDLSDFSIVLVDQDLDGLPANAQSGAAEISSNGRFVAFTSSATHLVADVTTPPPVAQLYVRDLQLGVTTLVSRDSTGAPISSSLVGQFSISGDGHFVAFATSSPTVMSNVTGGQFQVYVRDVVGGSTALASASTYGVPAMGYQVAIDDQALSDDGRFVVFASDAPNLINDDTNGLQDVFLRDMVNGTTQRVSADSRGQTPLLQSRNASGDAVIDGSGRFVVYQNGARLVAFDAETDLSFNVDVASSFKEYANSVTGQPALSADGRTIVYSSAATNLVPGDTDSGSDIYVVDLDPRD